MLLLGAIPRSSRANPGKDQQLTDHLAVPSLEVINVNLSREVSPVVRRGVAELLDIVHCLGRRTANNDRAVTLDVSQEPIQGDEGATLLNLVVSTTMNVDLDDK